MSIQTEAAAAAAPAGQYRALRNGTLLVSSTLVVLAGAVISPALPAMRATFTDVENVDFWVRQVLTFPALFIVLGAPVAGYLIDTLVGRKRMLIAAIVLFGFSGTSGYLATSLVQLLIGRAVLGLAVGALMTSVTTLVADYFEGRARANFLGYQSAVMGLGGGAFLLAGGILAESDWRNPFLIHLFAFAVLPFVIIFLREPARLVKPRLTTAAARPLARETLSAAPIRLMTFVLSAVLIIQIVFYFIPVQLPFDLVARFQATASDSGLALALMTVSFSTTAAMAGWICSRLSRMSAMLLGFSATGIGYMLIGWATGWPAMIVGLLLGGLGIALVMPNLSAWLAEETPLPLRGRVLSSLTTTVFLGQFLSPVAAQVLGALAGHDGSYVVVGVVLLVIAALVMALRGQLNRLLAGS